MTKTCLSLGITTVVFLQTAGCSDTASPVPLSDMPSEMESTEGGSLFASADENKLRRERALATDIARSLSQFEGVEKARLHLSLADHSVLLNSRETQSHAAVLILHAPDAAPNETKIRDFILAAVPALTVENLRIVFSRSEETPEKITNVGYLRVTEASATALRITLAALLFIALLTAVGLILAGISLRSLRRSTDKTHQTKTGNRTPTVP